MKVKFRKLNPNAKTPIKAHPTDAGFDIFSLGFFCIAPGDRLLVSTGISIELPVGYEAQVRPRSGLALNHGITVLNAPGTIDANYRGEIGVILINHGDRPFYTSEQTKIAQLVIAPVTPCKFVEVEALSETDRGDKGFGSTDEVSHERS